MHSVNKHEVTECGRAKCLDCNTTFACIGGARKHYKRWHMADKNGNSFIYKYCNGEFVLKYSLKQHVRDIHGFLKKFNHEKLEAIEDGRFKCLDCNKTFSSLKTAKSHLKHVHMTDRNDRKFSCKLCSQDKVQLSIF